MILVDSMRQVTARTEGEWSAIWRQHAANRPQPAMDFPREMVVGIFLGSRPTAGRGAGIVGDSGRAVWPACTVPRDSTRAGRGGSTGRDLAVPPRRNSDTLRDDSLR